MNSNKIMWGIVAVVVLITISLSVETSNQRGQAMDMDPEATPPKVASSPDLSKYAIVDFDATPEGLTQAQIEERRIKNKRYDASLTVMPRPPAGADGLTGYDVEPETAAIPFDQSRLIVVGRVTGSKAHLSNAKKGVYTEYQVTVEQIIKPDGEMKNTTGQILTMDRAGGVVRYSSGRTILYRIAGQDLPEAGGRYVLFLSKDEPDNPNYKIVTAYRLEAGTVSALDTGNDRLSYNGRSEADFLSFIVSEQEQKQSRHE